MPTCIWLIANLYLAHIIFFLFDLILYAPFFLGCTSCPTKQRLMCLAQGHNAVQPVRLEPATYLESNTLPLRSFIYY